MLGPYVLANPDDAYKVGESLLIKSPEISGMLPRLTDGYQQIKNEFDTIDSSIPPVHSRFGFMPPVMNFAASIEEASKTIGHDCKALLGSEITKNSDAHTLGPKIKSLGKSLSESGVSMGETEPHYKRPTTSSLLKEGKLEEAMDHDPKFADMVRQQQGKSKGDGFGR